MFLIIKKQGASTCSPLEMSQVLLASAIAVARHKFVHTTCGVHKFGLTGVERVTRVRDLKLDQRVLNAVDFNRVLRSCCRAAEELSTVRHIFENHYAVVLRMNSFFHKNLRFGAFSIQLSAFSISDG